MSEKKKITLEERQQLSEIWDYVQRLSSKPIDSIEVRFPVKEEHNE